MLTRRFIRPQLRICLHIRCVPQDELDAYDRHQRELEEKLDEKTAALIHLQRVTMEHHAASPVKNSELVEALGDWAGAPPQLRLRAASAASAGAVGALAGILPEHLIATKQFRPFEDAAAAARGDTTPAPGALLSAGEKIRELSRLLETARAERERLAREVEDVQAEKVSMEYLLREKLEKLVQSEIESRLAAYQRDGVAIGGGAAASAGGDSSSGGPSGAAYASMVASSNRQLQGELAARTEELTAARSQCSALEEEVRALRRRAQLASGPGDSEAAISAAVSEAVSAVAAAVASEGRDATSVQQLRDRLAVHVKERRAIHTIMEQKIKTLVDSIAAAAAGVVTPGAAPLPQLMRDAQALQRLVNASITALHNSEHEQQQLEAGGGYGGGSAAAGAAATPLPLGRASAPPPQLPPHAGAQFSGAPSFSAATPASIDAMIQRRKDELARARGGSGGMAEAQGMPLQAGARPASAARGRPG